MIGIFRGIELGHRALDYHLERANVLAGNVANVDTPGFRPLELVRPEERGSSGASLALTGTDGAHLGGSGGLSASGFDVQQEQVVNPGNDENTVSLEHELAKVSANQLRYDGAARMVQLQLGQLRYAANDGNG